MILYLAIALLVVVIDQVVKFWVVNHIEFGETIWTNNPILSITHIRNEGAAWSILEGKMWFFYIVTIITVGIVIYMLAKYRTASKWFTVGLSLVLGGAIGNFIDRLRVGYVVDMFQFEFMSFPIFNVADIALTIGVGCVLIYILIDEKMNKV